jgi:hypothetical protein
MIHMVRAFASVLVVGVLALTSGCGMIFNRTVAEVKGSSSDATAVPGSGGESYGRFRSLEVMTPTAEGGGLIPSDFKSFLVSMIKKELTQGKEPIFTGGAPALTVEPHIMWFNKGNALFPHKYAVAIFHLRGDGADMGKVQIVTKSEATGTGADDMAESMAKELGKYFKKHGKSTKGGKDKD